MIRLTLRLPLRLPLRVPSPSWREPVLRRAPAVATAMLGGIVAAGAGLGVMAAIVLFIWTTSPYVGSSPHSALHIATALWLLSHGANVLRTSALTGASVPVGVTPLLLSAVPVWLVHRAAVNAVALPDDGDFETEADTETGIETRIATGDDPGALGALATTAWLVAGYLLVAMAALAFTAQGALRGDPLTTLLCVPLVVAPVALAGAWTGCCRPSLIRLTAALPPGLRRALSFVPLPYGGGALAVRAAASAAAVLVVGGALLSTAALVWHGQAARNSFDQLTGSLSGRFAVLLLAAALVPNAAVWGAAYALGPGFAVGTGGAVTIRGAYGYPPVLPRFPLLAELPAPAGQVDGVTWRWLALLVPLAAAAVLARCVARQAVAHRWPWIRTGLVALLAAVACAVVMALAAAFAGGPMGVGVLSRFGPAALETGKAAFAWTAGIGVPAAVVGRWCGLHAAGIAARLRRTRSDAEPEAEPDFDLPEWVRPYPARPPTPAPRP